MGGIKIFHRESFKKGETVYNKIDLYRKPEGTFTKGLSAF